MKKYNVNNKYIVKAKSYADAVKAVKSLKKDSYLEFDGLDKIDPSEESYFRKKGLKLISQKRETVGWSYKFQGSKDDILKYVKSQHLDKEEFEIYDALKDKAFSRDSLKDAKYSTIEQALEKEFDEIAYSWETGGYKAPRYVSLEEAEEILDNLEYDNLVEKNKFTKEQVKKLYPKYREAYYKKQRDSLKDDESDIEFLSNEERQAIEDYKKAIANTADPKLLRLFAHILKEEIEHLEELETETIEDADEEANDVLRKYQEWVDYDMKHYHKISEETLSKLKKAGLEVVKDKYGDYEVIARDSINDSPLSLKQNTSISALKSNMKNFLNNPDKFWKSLKSNLETIKADLKEWEQYYNKDLFDEYPNLQAIAKKLSREYLDIIQNFPAEDQEWIMKNYEYVKELNTVISEILRTRNRYLWK